MNSADRYQHARTLIVCLLFYSIACCLVCCGSFCAAAAAAAELSRRPSLFSEEPFLPAATAATTTEAAAAALDNALVVVLEQRSLNLYPGLLFLRSSLAGELEQPERAASRLQLDRSAYPIRFDSFRFGLVGLLRAPAGLGRLFVPLVSSLASIDCARERRARTGEQANEKAHRGYPFLSPELSPASQRVDRLVEFERRPDFIVVVVVVAWA